MMKELFEALARISHGDTRKGYLSWYKCCANNHLYRKGG